MLLLVNSLDAKELTEELHGLTNFLTIILHIDTCILKEHIKLLFSKDGSWAEMQAEIRDQLKVKVSSLRYEHRTFEFTALGKVTEQ